MARKTNPVIEARKRSGLTQQDIADKLGCTAVTVGNIERNLGKMTLQQLGDWFSFMGTDGKAIIREYVDSFFPMV